MKSTVTTIQEQNQLAMHNVQCMKLCNDATCHQGQLPSNLYDWNTTAQQPTTQKSATATTRGPTCTEQLNQLCDACWQHSYVLQEGVILD